MDGLKVKMSPFPQPVVGGAKYNVTCIGFGVKPPPSISWHVNGRQITHNVKTVRKSHENAHFSIHLTSLLNVYNAFQFTLFLVWFV